MTNPLQDLRDLIHTNPDNLVTHEDAREFIKQHKGSLIELHDEYFDQGILTTTMWALLESP